MSRRSGRGPKRHSRDNVHPFPARREPRAAPDRPGREGEPVLGGAMTLVPDTCHDDAPALRCEGPGTTLRRAREARRLSLDEIARRTKIGKSILVALEAGDVQRLPAAIYTRGFIKAVAREVGLDPEATAHAYLADLAPSGAGEDTSALGQGVATTRAAAAAAAAPAAHWPVENHASRLARVTTAAAVIGLIVYIATLGPRDERADATSGPVAATHNDDAVAASRTNDPVASSSDGADATDLPLRVELTSQGPCWLSAVVDGERVLSRTMQAGERHTLALEERAVLRIGEPGALSISINGRPGRPLGRPGQPVSVTITRDNYQAFLIS